MLTPPCSRNDDATAIYVDDDTRIQILDSMPDLPRADKEQCGAFIVSFGSPLIRPGPQSSCCVSPKARRACAGGLVGQPGRHHPALPRL